MLNCVLISLLYEPFYDINSLLNVLMIINIIHKMNSRIKLTADCFSWRRRHRFRHFGSCCCWCRLIVGLIVVYMCLYLLFNKIKKKQNVHFTLSIWYFMILRAVGFSRYFDFDFSFVRFYETRPTHKEEEKKQKTW